MTEVADLEIESIASGGDGVARWRGMAVFVPRTAPGDRVRASVQVHRRLGRGSIEAMLEPSPARVDPQCLHYVSDHCGGCQLQHMEYGAQLSAKSGMIRDALTRIAKRPVAAPTVEPSPEVWRYRRKLTLALRRMGEGGDWVIGLHRYDDPADVFDLDDCPITDARVLAIWGEVRAAAEFYPPAEELRGSVQLIEDGAVVVLQGGHEWPRRRAFFEAVPSATALWWKPPHRWRTLVAQRSRRSGNGERIGASFAQVNAAAAALLHAYVVERAAGHSPASVIDAYAGTGATAVPLASRGARVTAIELDRDAAARCGADLAPPSRALAGRVEELLPQTLPADVVILNPPRVGVDARVAAVLESASAPPRAILYVSCDPATLARDLSRVPRYRIASLRAFDLFPQTSHVETVCELVPAA